MCSAYSLREGMIRLLELTFRGLEVIELENFNAASSNDIASVHTRAYVLGLEKAMDQALKQGIILIEGSGPTYATVDTFQESLVAAGAGIALIDAVVQMSNSSIYRS
ncbi:unnamed protein product [Prunus armeniaca]|uniref:Uncharacterized protein n=1 Tax=Prunus armeniaca TaxID=36596 RepID=A0A6J5UTE8_PRUAR|nr:unnamed protein product [Prunus armeniaca]CAB4308995.1 unnamed protein product [Prunus armeniaca]